MSRPRREPENRACGLPRNPRQTDTLGRLSLPPRLAIAVALGAGQGVLVQVGTKQMHSLTYEHEFEKKVDRHSSKLFLFLPF